MAESTGSQKLLGVEEYLKLERDATVRHEYVGGEIHALASASRRHSRIAGNIFRRLANAAAGGPCRVHQSDMKLRAADDVVYYPDVMVVCGPEPDDPYVERDPCLVVEVTSPSTESIDRREKLAAYRDIASLKAYLLVEQERQVVERYFRDEEGTWLHAALYNEGSFPIPCPETSLSLPEVYEGLQRSSM